VSQHCRPVLPCRAAICSASVPRAIHLALLSVRRCHPSPNRHLSRNRASLSSPASLSSVVVRWHILAELHSRKVAVGDRVNGFPTNSPRNSAPENVFRHGNRRQGPKSVVTCFADPV